jgi:DNA polymerase-3 subunit delta
MGGEITPERVLNALQKGKLAPYYLFYGPGEFRLEKVLEKIRAGFVPPPAQDLNVEIFYGGETDPAEIVARARSMPFLSPNRLLIVRRIEKLSTETLNRFLPYLERSVASTCLVFVASKADFKKKFFKFIREQGRAVFFRELKDREVLPWIKETAKELGLEIEGRACAQLQQVVGNRSRDLHAELEKLSLRHGKAKVGVEQVQELAVHSRIYTIFELMNAVSAKRCADALRVLGRFLEEEDKKDGPLRIIGMLNRQVRLLWYTKAVLAKGGGVHDVATKLGPARFSAPDFVKYSKGWSVAELTQGIRALYRAEGRLKSGSHPKLIVENLILALCRPGRPTLTAID